MNQNPTLDQSEPDRAARRAFALEVTERLRRAGHTALWAGGCVRDLLLGEEPADFDVATDAHPQAVIRLFPRSVPVGISFGVVRVRGRNPDGGEVEVATFRSDGAYVDGRRPESVTFGTAEVDASRRDFTINGMFYDPIERRVIDYVGGEADLRAGVIRAIGDPSARFAEDKLRLLRAVRFAARFGFPIEPATRAALVSMAPQVRVVAAERIAQEVRRMLVHPSRARAMDLAMETGLVEAVLPDLLPLRLIPAGGGSSRAGHDLWRFTIHGLEFLPAEPSFSLALAMLLHAIGKSQGNDETAPVQAGRIADRIARDLKLANSERDQIRWLVENQKALIRASELSRARLKRILASPGIGELLDLHRALAQANFVDVSEVDYCERYLRVQPDGPIDPPPLLTGDDLKAMGLKPGRHFAVILERVRDAQLGREIETTDEAAALVERLVAASDS